MLACKLLSEPSAMTPNSTGFGNLKTNGAIGRRPVKNQLVVTLKPGAHSFRVLRRNFPPQISVLEVKPGGDQFLSAEFGAHSEDPLRYSPPSSISISDPLPVNVSLPEGEWDQSMVLWVYAGPPGGSFQARRMTRLSADSKTFAALVPMEVLLEHVPPGAPLLQGGGRRRTRALLEIYSIPRRELRTRRPPRRFRPSSPRCFALRLPFRIPAPVLLWVFLLLGHGLVAFSPLPAAWLGLARIMACAMAALSLACGACGARYHVRVRAAVALTRLLRDPVRGLSTARGGRRAGR